MKYLAVVFSAALGLSAAACGSSSSGGGVGGATGQDAGHDAGSGGKGTGGKGAGGATGGAAGNPACNGPKYSHTSTFGAILDGWVVATNSTPGTLAPIPGPDGGTASGTIVEIDNTDGMPATPVLGSVKLTIPFDAPNETLLFAQNMTSLNMAGETVTAFVKLSPGTLNTGPANVGTAAIALKTTGLYNYAPGNSVALDSSLGWQMLTIDVSNPPGIPPQGYDPCDVREIDILIQTGGSGTYTTGVVHIDSIAIGAPGVVVDAGPDDTGTSTDTGSTVDAPIDMPSSTDTASGGDTAAASDAATDG